MLEPDQVSRLLTALAAHPFVDGAATAGGIARGVKHNLQVEPSGGIVEQERLISSALYANGVFQAFAFPRRLRTPVFSRYEPGMRYGAHVDGAIMPDKTGPLRADLAVTVFLSPPESYDGGELMLSLADGGEQAIKLDVGEAVVYAADSVHRVAPVTRGVRMAAVTWVQSAVSDSRMRSVLFDLYGATRQAEAGEDPRLLLSKTYNNLLRMAAEF